jgi:hypothetical protein
MNSQLIKNIRTPSCWQHPILLLHSLYWNSKIHNAALPIITLLVKNTDRSAKHFRISYKKKASVYHFSTKIEAWCGIHYFLPWLFKLKTLLLQPFYLEQA